VWQRYGGRCAECKADTYLEFDHIIPVAKGGGNSDTNVQLLCRKCNLTKSDNI
jgi:5-methylcytosine-specific restriction endonuclease McrA